MNIKVLFNQKQKIHYVVRVVEKTAPEWKHKSDISDILNDLLLTRTPEQLMKVIDKMPSLYPHASFGDENQAYSFVEAKDMLSQQFNLFDKDRLEAELFLESAKPLKGNKRKIISFAENYCTEGSEYAASLGLFNEDECVVLVEHLQDWMMLRNSLSLAARLLGQIEDDTMEVSLVDAGFRHQDNTRLKQSMYIIPFKYNTFFAKKFAPVKSQDPLFCSMVNEEIVKTNFAGLGNVYKHCLEKDRSDTYFITKPQATQEYPSLVKELFSMERESSEEQTLYLCVEDNGTQLDMAKRVVSSFAIAFRKLREKESSKSGKDEELLGWEYDPSGEFEKLASPRIVARSFVSGLFYQLIYHPGKRITICGECGNAVLSREQGTRNKYCSDSCRVQASKKRKRDEENA